MSFAIPVVLALLDAAGAASPLTSAAEQLTQYGILGVVVCVCFAAIMKLSTELQRVNEARIDEAKRREEQLVAVVREATAANQAVASSLESVRDALDEVRGAVREQSTEIRATGAEVKAVVAQVTTLPERLKR